MDAFKAARLSFENRIHEKERSNVPEWIFGASGFSCFTEEGAARIFENCCRERLVAKNRMRHWEQVAFKNFEYSPVETKHSQQTLGIHHGARCTLMQSVNGDQLVLRTMRANCESHSGSTPLTLALTI